MALLLAVVLAGCTQSPEPLEDAEAAILDDRCVGAAQDSCEVRGGVLYVTGLDLGPPAPGISREQPQTSPRLGLLVDGLSMPLVIADVDLTGFWIGIALRNTCSACVVEVRDSRIETLFAGIQAGRQGPALGGLRVVRTELVSIDSPPEERLAIGEVFGVGIDLGLHGAGHFEGDVVLDEVALTAEGRALGPGFVWNLVREGTLDARHVTLHGFERSIVLSGNPESLVRLRDVAIDCRDLAFHETSPAARALAVPGPSSIDVDGLDVRNCSWPEHCYPQCGEAIRIGGMGLGRTDAAGTVEMRNVTLLNNSPRTIAITQHELVRFEDMRIEDALLGATEISATALEMRNVTFRNLPWRAMLASVERLDIDRSVFEGNGARSAQDGFILGGGLVVLGEGSPLVVRNSTFVGNEGVGLFSSGTLVDAASNWWGSPLGPSTRTRLPVLGDVADGMVLTAPHLTAPP